MSLCCGHLLTYSGNTVDDCISMLNGSPDIADKIVLLSEAMNSSMCDSCWDYVKDLKASLISGEK
jgi:hypothetical protein